MEGYVINFMDFFTIRSQKASTQFYINVFKKAAEKDFANQEKKYLINASTVPSMLKAKLYASYDMVSL